MECACAGFTPLHPWLHADGLNGRRTSCRAATRHPHPAFDWDPGRAQSIHARIPFVLVVRGKVPLA